MKFGIGKRKRDEIDEEIDSILECMRKLNPTEEKYSVLLERLIKLKGLKAEKQKIKPDTVLLVAGNIVGLLLILNFERLNIITSKALSFIIRGRV